VAEEGLVGALLAARRVLERAKVPYALCGGLAANLYRKDVRATMDVDLTIIVSPARLAHLVEDFRAAGWRAESYWKKAELLRLSHDRLPRVDCLLATTDYEQSAIRRAAAVTIERRRLRVLRPEDLIVFKLIAGRARDYEAVAAILNARREKLDEEYITGWLAQFGLAERWGRALEEAQREGEDQG
jgi:predicted nucleotidyltransferase